jgi:hypothetical protein
MCNLIFFLSSRAASSTGSSALYSVSGATCYELKSLDPMLKAHEMTDLNQQLELIRGNSITSGAERPIIDSRLAEMSQN